MDIEINYESLGGWAISKELIDWILVNIPKGSIILELGSGYGTKELVKQYTVFSVEDNLQWVGFEAKSNYIYAPLIDGWYDTEILKREIPKKYDLLIVDGPIGVNRINLINHYSMFKNDIPIIIDDINREKDLQLSLFLYDKMGKKEMIKINSDNKEFAILI